MQYGADKYMLQRFCRFIWSCVLYYEFIYVEMEFIRIKRWVTLYSDVIPRSAADSRWARAAARAGGARGNSGLRQLMITLKTIKRVALGDCRGKAIA
ncbi:hypothetical protein EVAR_85543_1 [Eumeta japonica]|uniref:Uncharacterized protein n=1 Tax=Eumeta variegata TaxID=151549 RepID=A0A4C1VEA6_EUMVA|nr:hypothetical protein EVAR_85543_1 [Eumeta japonica]